MKLHYITLVSLILGNLNLMAAETAQEQPSTPKHRRSSTEVARTAFADEREGIRQLQKEVAVCVDKRDKNGLNEMLKKYSDASLQEIVTTGIEDIDVLDNVQKDLRHIETAMANIQVLKDRKMSTKEPINQISGDIQKVINKFVRFRQRTICSRGVQLLGQAQELQRKIKNPQPATAPRPLPSSHASDARTMRPWIAGGLAAGIAIVVAVVCYFKWIKPTAAAH